MSLSSLLVHDVTILRASSNTDRYHNAAKDWASPTTVTVKGWIARTSANEERGEREAEVSGWVLYLLPETTISGADRVGWNGLVFEVDGPPNHAWTPRGEHHIEVPLRIAEG